MKKILFRAAILGGLSMASVSGQSLPDQAFSLRNWGGSVYLENLTSADGVLTVLANGRFLFRSLDMGKSWRAFPLPLDATFRPFWQTVLFDPTAGLFYGTGIGAIYTAAPRASGWTRLFEGHPNFYSVDGATFASNGWPSDGINVSRDGGRTWKTTDRFAANGGGGIPLAAGACAYVAAGDDPISVSCDGGVTWKSSAGDTLSNSARTMIRHEGAVIALTGRGLVRSVDNGKSWSRWRGNLVGDSLAHSVTCWGNSLFLFTNTGAHRSVDGGRTWTALASPEPGPQPSPFSLDLVEAEGALFTLANRGLMTSTDGGRTWSMVALRSILSPMQSLALAGNRLLAQADEGIFVSRDSGTTWDASLPAAAGQPWTAFGGSASLYAAGSQDGKIRITADAGATWSRPYPLPFNDPVTGLAGFGGSILAGSAGRLMRLTTPDSAWSTYPLPAADSLRFIASGPDALLLGAASHLWEMGPDGSFADRSAGILPGKIRSAWILDQCRYAYTMDGYLHRWCSGEISWIQMPQPFSRHIVSLAGTRNRLLAATYMETLVSEDGGATWTQFTRDVNAIGALTYDGGLFFAADGAGGCWMMRLEESGTSLRSHGGLKARIRRAPSYPGEFMERSRRLDGRWISR